MQIYTRQGDQGQTSLFGGARVRKDTGRVEAYGTVDELNSALGLAVALQPQPAVRELLRHLQSRLFDLGADLATPEGGRVARISSYDTAQIESEIDRVSMILAPLQHFILPGGSPAAAQLHVARTICRRAERGMVELHASQEVNAEALPYLNRLSDYLFVLARYENHLSGVREEKWESRA